MDRADWIKYLERINAGQKYDALLANYYKEKRKNVIAEGVGGLVDMDYPGLATMNLLVSLLDRNGELQIWLANFGEQLNDENRWRIECEEIPLPPELMRGLGSETSLCLQAEIFKGEGQVYKVDCSSEFIGIEGGMMLRSKALKLGPWLQGEGNESACLFSQAACVHSYAKGIVGVMLRFEMEKTTEIDDGGMELKRVGGMVVYIEVYRRREDLGEANLYSSFESVAEVEVFLAGLYWDYVCQSKADAEKEVNRRSETLAEDERRKAMADGKGDRNKRSETDADEDSSKCLTETEREANEVQAGGGSSKSTTDLGKEVYGGSKMQGDEDSSMAYLEDEELIQDITGHTLPSLSLTDGGGVPANED